MYTRDYVKQFIAKRRLGQNFLLDSSVADLEARFAKGRNVLEMGPGLGILTEALCRYARKVLAVEKDRRLFLVLGAKLQCGNLELLNSDFFNLGKEAEGYDMLVSNIPYNLSSKTIFWIMERRIEAVICLQTEFVGHMTAESGTRKYSRLSVVSSLLLNVERIAKVSAESFYPKPKVDSEVVRITCKDFSISKEESDAISLLMEHKKKKLRNAIIDSSRKIGIEREKARDIAEKFTSKEKRVFKMRPQEILHSAREFASALRLLE